MYRPGAGKIHQSNDTMLFFPLNFDKSCMTYEDAVQLYQKMLAQHWSSLGRERVAVLRARDLCLNKELAALQARYDLTTDQASSATKYLCGAIQENQTEIEVLLMQNRDAERRTTRNNRFLNAYALVQRYVDSDNIRYNADDDIDRRYPAPVEEPQQAQKGPVRKLSGSSSNSKLSATAQIFCPPGTKQSAPPIRHRLSGETLYDADAAGKQVAAWREDKEFSDDGYEDTEEGGVSLNIAEASSSTPSRSTGESSPNSTHSGESAASKKPTAKEHWARHESERSFDETQDKEWCPALTE